MNHMNNNFSRQGQGQQQQGQQHVPIHPHELFVGDLSFFCEESDLLELFSQFGVVEGCRIVRNQARHRSLMFGFVCLSTRESALAAVEAVNNQIFMGRPMK